ncbi:MAG: hypothetical protein IJ385_06120 [Ruminiclostridium sp.]|nr:hypothetical protein [Ruminiclostridium sp.]
MSEKLFKGIVIALLVLGMISIIAITVYTFILQKDCSIISYIANGR